MLTALDGDGRRVRCGQQTTTIADCRSHSTSSSVYSAFVDWMWGTVARGPYRRQYSMIVYFCNSKENLKNNTLLRCRTFIHVVCPSRLVTVGDRSMLYRNSETVYVKTSNLHRHWQYFAENRNHIYLNNPTQTLFCRTIAIVDVEVSYFRHCKQL